MTKYKVLAILFIFCQELTGQDNPDLLMRELHVTVDNDALFFGKNDKYYSSGIFIKYRRLVKEDKFWFRAFNKNERLSKAIVSYDLAHRMYTSSDIDETSEEKIDRPYAGWANVNIGMNYHFINNSTLIFDYDLGWLGPGTKTGEIQVWWHDFLGMKQPNGWGYQINNTIATNLSVLYQKRLLAAGNTFDLIGEQFAQVGTIRNNLRSGMTFRLGRINGLDNSVYTYSKLGQQRKRVSDIPQNERMQELYFYINTTVEHVFYNTTIEGNFIGTPSEFTKEAQPWVFHHTWGLGRSGTHFDYRIAVIFRSKEVKDAGRHKYVAITLVQRF